MFTYLIVCFFFFVFLWGNRLRSRNEELENEILISKEKLKQLEEDRSDVVAHLKRKLEENIEESRELSERLLALEELRKEEQKSFKKKEESMELEYRTMESNLSAEVKLASKNNLYWVLFQYYL